MTRAFLRFACLTLLLFLPRLRAQPELLSPDEIAFVDKTWPGTKKTSTGIRYLIQRPGDGPSPKPGERVGVLYSGYLLHGEKFDEQLNPAKPFVFRADREQVIAGWDQVIQLMKLHEKRLVIIPSSLAYGSRGHAPRIPRDATLVFVMELVSIQPE